MEHPTHRQDRTVYVNCIARCTTEDDLFLLFQRAGPIEKVIFKNADGTPQHALIVFRRIESVMFCLDNIDYFKLNGQQLGIRPLRESRLTKKSRPVPHSAGFETAKQFFNFDQESIHRFRQRSSESECRASPLTSTSFSPPDHSSLFLQPPPPPTRRVGKPSPLQLPQAQVTRQIWVPADQRDAFAEPFTAPPFSTPSSHFVFPGQTRTLDQFHGMFSNDQFNTDSNTLLWPNMDSFSENF